MTQYLMTHDCYDPKKNVVFKEGKIYAEGDFSKDLLRQYKEHGLVADAPAAQTTSAPLKLDDEGKIIQPEQSAKAPKPSKAEKEAAAKQAKAEKDALKKKAKAAADERAKQADEAKAVAKAKHANNAKEQKKLDQQAERERLKAEKAAEREAKKATKAADKTAEREAKKATKAADKAAKKLAKDGGNKKAQVADSGDEDPFFDGSLEDDDKENGELK